MATKPTFVIVGAGLAGARAAETLRADGFDGRLLLLGDEAEQPYERPPLSKAYLRGETDRDSLYVHQDGFYANHDDRAAHLDPGQLDRPVRPPAGVGLGRAHQLPAAPAGHRRRPAPPATCPGRTWPASTTCAPARTADVLAAAAARAEHVVVVGDRLDRQRGRRLPAPARPGRHPDRPGHRPAGPGARPRDRRRLPRPARRPRRPARPRHPGRRLPRPRPGRGGRDRRRAHRRGRPGPGRRRRRSADRAGRGGWPARPTTGCWSTSSWRPSAQPACTPPATSPPPGTPATSSYLRVEHWANALNQGPAAARNDARHPHALRPAALLLLRPVRPGHGVLRVRGRLGPGGGPRRPGRSREFIAFWLQGRAGRSPA